MYEENSLVGKVLNERYEILEVVGSGGMATVYKAECKLLNRFVAVKVLKDSLRYDLDLKEKFNAEAQAAAKLSHNNIVSIFDVGEIDGLNYIVMEYIDGITLKEYISKNKPIHWKVARNIAIQIGMALEHAHANGIIHRDIKPHNILITKDNVIKVADFGIASAVSSETVVAGKSDGAAMGSVHYISPEQARGGYVTETTDIYSLGVIMYEMVTGQLPFDGDNPVSIAMMKLEQDPINCKVINLDIPQDMAEIIMRAFARDPSARYQTVQEMLVALKKLGTQGAVSTAVIRSPEERREIIKQKKQKSEKNANNKMILRIVISMIIVIVLFSVGTFAYLNWNAPEVQVPDLLDKTLEEAIELAEERGLKIDEAKIEYETSEEFEEGKIMSQKPGANTYAKKNKKISLVISQGKTEGDIEVISVLGLQYEDAAGKLEEMGLNVKKVEREDADAEIGEVISQSPKKGVKVSEGTVISLYVCTSHPEEEHTEVPGVIGMTKSQAESTLKKAGFTLGNVKKETSDKPAGEIIRQEPSAGSESPKGTYVDIVVSGGKEEEPENNENNSSNVTPPNNNNTTTTPPTQTTPPETTTPQQPDDTVEAQTKTITIPLPEDGDDIIQVKVVANGKEIYNKEHPKTDGAVNIPVKAKKDAQIQVYFGDKLVVDKTIEFN